MDEDTFAARVLVAQAVALERGAAKNAEIGRVGKADSQFSKAQALREVAGRLCAKHKLDVADVMRVPVGRGVGSAERGPADDRATAEAAILAKALELDFDAFTEWMRGAMKV